MNAFNNLPISRKLMLGFGLLVVLIVISGVIGYTSLNTVTENMNHLADQEAARLQNLHDVAFNVMGARAAEEMFLKTLNTKYLDDVNRHFDAAEKSAATVAGLTIEDKDKEATVSIGEAVKETRGNFNDIVALIKRRGLTEDQGLRGEMRNSVHAIEGALLSALGGNTGGKLYADMLTLRRHEKDYLLRGDARYKDKLHTSAQTFLADLAASDLPPETKADLKNKLQAYLASFDAIVRLDTDINSRLDELEADADKLETTIETGVADAQRDMEAAQTEAAQTASTASTVLIVSILVSIIIAITLSYLITRSITRPLKEMVDAANSFRDGDFNAREIRYRSRDELGVLADAMQGMINTLRNILGEVERVAGSAARGDLTVKASVDAKGGFARLVDYTNRLVDVLRDTVIASKTMAQRVLTTSQGLASAAEEMNAGMEQLSSASQDVAEGSQKLSEMAQRSAQNLNDLLAILEQSNENARKLAENGAQVIAAAREVEEAARNAGLRFEEIQQSIEKTSQSVNEMTNSIEKVGEMGNIITDVAEQTNLLALNAAIEAARAGEAGRGFAVVADAVKNLAEQVKNAAGESIAAVNEIKEAGQTSVETASKTSNDASEGGAVLKDALNGVEKIAKNLDETEKLVEEVKTGSDKGLELIKSVVAGVDEVASVSEESSSAAEEASSAVEEQTGAIQELSSETQRLADLSQELMNQLDRFKLPEEVETQIKNVVSEVETGLLDRIGKDTHPQQPWDREPGFSLAEDKSGNGYQEGAAAT